MSTNEYKLGFKAEEIDNILAQSTESIRYTEQNLEEVQKTQARTNIGAIGSADIQNFITEIREECVTESELDAKGYITNKKDATIVALSTQISNTRKDGEKYVGYGTCIVMHDESNCIVFDLGNDDGTTLLNYLSDNEIKKIDAIFISHFHIDHYNYTTLSMLVSKYKAETMQVVLPHTCELKLTEQTDPTIEDTREGTTDQYDNVVDLCNSNEVTVEAPTEESKTYTFGDISVECYNVSKDKLGTYYNWTYNEYGVNNNVPNYNNFSMVNVITYEGRRIVITGDIMEPAIEKNLDVISPADIIFVPHHGLDLCIPHCAFNRLISQHAVINSAYDTSGALTKVSRIFAGELLKKGCRVTTTYPTNDQVNPIKYCITRDGITIMQPGELAGDELYPCALKAGQDLDVLPDGEYITPIGNIAESIINRPQFLYPTRKFKVKVETTYYTDAGIRTQTAYSVDTNDAPEMARRNSCSDDPLIYSDWLALIPDVEHIWVTSGANVPARYACATDAEIDETIISIINAMPNYSSHRIVLSLTSTFTSLGGGHFYTEIFKQTENYAIITAISPIHKSYVRRSWLKDGPDSDPNAVGRLYNWEWDDNMVTALYELPSNDGWTRDYAVFTGGIEDVQLAANQGTIIKLDGAEGNEEYGVRKTAENAWQYTVVECKPYDKFLITVKGGVGPRAYIWLTSGNKLIAMADSDETHDANITLKNKLIYAPPSAAKLVVNHCISSGVDPLIEKVAVNNKPRIYANTAEMKAYFREADEICYVLTDDSYYSNGYRGNYYRYSPYNMCTEIKLDKGGYAHLVVPEFAPIKSNHECIKTIFDIAETYKDAQLTYKSSNGPFSNIGNTKGIQCSQFVNALLQGLMYENSKLNGKEENTFETGGCRWLNKYAATDDGCLSANELAKFAACHGWFVETDTLESVQPGDILFLGSNGRYDEDSMCDEVQWRGIYHVMMCVARDDSEEKIAFVHAANRVGRPTIDYCKVSWNDLSKSNKKDTGFLVGFARFPMNYRDISDKELSVLNDAGDF